MANTTILTAEQELQLRKPIDDYVGKIQSQINELRVCKLGRSTVIIK